LKDETKGKTVIIVAQRISTIMNAEKILVLDNGKIVDEGRHADLLRTSAVYREIATSQLSEKELAQAD
jgi:ATP-binding cassette subfamily B multidrug efflux pump